jgi:hypothetical protein
MKPVLESATLKFSGIDSPEDLRAMIQGLNASVFPISEFYCHLNYGAPLPLSEHETISVIEFRRRQRP